MPVVSGQRQFREQGLSERDIPAALARVDCNYHFRSLSKRRYTYTLTNHPDSSSTHHSLSIRQSRKTADAALYYPAYETKLCGPRLLVDALSPTKDKDVVITTCPPFFQPRQPHTLFSLLHTHRRLRAISTHHSSRPSRSHRIHTGAGLLPTPLTARRRRVWKLKSHHPPAHTLRAPAAFYLEQHARLGSTG